ncbi:hypothetical protein [uncultured Vibrio sp.]|uniref:hypothetical protein n=1 Tax=uncultured Vibrio sp. TaxID=114054 RepID=UPI0025E2E3CF|nr:hypothetical protein [uncultured Vibrio sp.]
MNLWALFPDSILEIQGILKLPYVAVVFYLFTLLLLIKQKNQRAMVAVFLLLSLTSSLIMLANFGPHVGHVIPPLSLLITAIFPITLFLLHVKKKRASTESEKENENTMVFTWFVISLAGLSHSLSWATWLVALARS